MLSRGHGIVSRDFLMSRDVERPYTEVPRVGNYIALGDSADDPYQKPWCVLSVQQDEDGVVALRFGFDGQYDPTPLVESLVRAGYVFVDTWSEHSSEAYRQHGRADAALAVKHQGPAPEAGVEVDQNVLAQGKPWYSDGELWGWCTSPTFLVVSHDPEAAAAAMHAAGQRFSFVNELGNEVSLEEAEDQVVSTPHYISDVYLTDDGPIIYADTGGDLSRLMGERMIEILVEELTARGVPARISKAPPAGTTLTVWNPAD